MIDISYIQFISNAQLKFHDRLLVKRFYIVHTDNKGRCTGV